MPDLVVVLLALAVLVAVLSVWRLVRVLERVVLPARGRPKKK